MRAPPLCWDLAPLCPSGGQQTGLPHIRQQLVQLGDRILRSGGICHCGNHRHCGLRTGRASGTDGAGGAGRTNGTLCARGSDRTGGAGGTLCASRARGSDRTGGAGGALRARRACGSDRTGGAGGALRASGARDPLGTGGAGGAVRTGVTLRPSGADRSGNNRPRGTGQRTGRRAAGWYAGLGAGGGEIGSHAFPLPPVPVCGQITIHHTIRSLFWDRSVWRPPHPSLCAWMRNGPTPPCPQPGIVVQFPYLNFLSQEGVVDARI